MKNEQEESESKAPPQKKTYDSPQLITHGNIREITQTIGISGGGDGTTKTGL